MNYIDRKPFSAMMAALGVTLVSPLAPAKEFELPSFAYDFLDNHCLDCHDAFEQKGDLNLEELYFKLEDSQIFEKWVLVRDQADHRNAS